MLTAALHARPCLTLPVAGESSLDCTKKVVASYIATAWCILLGSMIRSLPPSPPTLIADSAGAIVNIARRVVGEVLPPLS